MRRGRAVLEAQAREANECAADLVIKQSERPDEYHGRFLLTGSLIGWVEVVVLRMGGIFMHGDLRRSVLVSGFAKRTPLESVIRARAEQDSLFGSADLVAGDALEAEWSTEKAIADLLDRRRANAISPDVARIAFEHLKRGDDPCDVDVLRHALGPTVLMEFGRVPSVAVLEAHAIIKRLRVLLDEEKRCYPAPMQASPPPPDEALP